MSRKRKDTSFEDDPELDFEEATVKDFFDKIDDEDEDEFNDEGCDCGICPECLPECNCGENDCTVCNDAEEDLEEFDDDEFYDAELEDVQGEDDEEPNA